MRKYKNATPVPKDMSDRLEKSKVQRRSPVFPLTINLDAMEIVKARCAELEITRSEMLRLALNYALYTPQFWTEVYDLIQKDRYTRFRKDGTGKKLV